MFLKKGTVIKMKIKELETKVNEKILERKLNKTNERNKYETELVVKELIKEVIKAELPEVNFEINKGWYTYGQNENRLYIYPSYKYFTAYNEAKIEVKVHKSKAYTNYYRGNYSVSKWYLNSITITVENKEETLESIYKEYVKVIDNIIKEREEKEAREKAEREEAQRKHEIEGREYATKVKNYIKDNNLNEKEFLQIVRDDYFWREFYDEV